MNLSSLNFKLFFSIVTIILLNQNNVKNNCTINNIYDLANLFCKNYNICL
jgi:hypothetical protein